MNNKEKINHLKSLIDKNTFDNDSTFEKQHSKEKLTALERINLLVDKGSFIHLNTFMESQSSDFGMSEKKFSGDGVITGAGLINGRKVFLASQDFTQMGGSLGLAHAKKIVYVQELALKTGVPFIMINDSGGARIQEGIDSLEGYARIFRNNVNSSGVIPQISVILGPCAGGAVYSPALTDFVFMVNKVSKMFITGPDVIKQVTGEEVTFESLGGAMTHNKISGVSSFFCSSETECFNDIKHLLSFLPSNNKEYTALKPNDDKPYRIIPDFNKIIPDESKKSYDMKDIIYTVMDDNEFLEVQPLFAPNIIVGFGRLNSRSVGIIANQPKVYAGCLDIDSSDKAARFVRFCDAFNIPLINFVDVPGYLPGTGQEYRGVIRHGAKLLYAFVEATVPKIAMIIRKSYGGAYIAMSAKPIGYDRVLAWPMAEIAVMGSEGAANIIFKKEINNSSNPETKREEKITEYREKFSTPYLAASRGYVDAVIEPQNCRMELINAIEMLISKKESKPSKKHGNIPL